MIELSSTFLRAVIYNVSYHCSLESLSRSPGFSIGDLLPRVPSSELSCLSNSTLSLLEPNSLCTHRRCVPLRTVVACGYAPSLRTCTSRLGTHRHCGSVGIRADGRYPTSSRTQIWPCAFKATVWSKNQKQTLLENHKKSL